MEVEFRKAGNMSKLIQLHRAMEIRSKMVNDPVNSLGIFAVGLGLCPCPGFSGHWSVDIRQLALAVSI